LLPGFRPTCKGLKIGPTEKLPGLVEDGMFASL